MKSGDMLQYLNYKDLNPKDSYWVSIFYGNFKKYGSLTKHQRTILTNIYTRHKSMESKETVKKSMSAWD